MSKSGLYQSKKKRAFNIHYLNLPDPNYELRKTTWHTHIKGKKACTQQPFTLSKGIFTSHLLPSLHTCQYERVLFESSVNYLSFKMMGVSFMG